MRNIRKQLAEQDAVPECDRFCRKSAYHYLLLRAQLLPYALVGNYHYFKIISVR